jgi:hypothetical protein
MTEPITPSTVQHLAVTVSEPDEHGHCEVTYADGDSRTWAVTTVRANGLTVPQPPPPTVPCTIGDIEFTLTREQVEIAAGWRYSPPNTASLTVGDAARRWVDAREDHS